MAGLLSGFMPGEWDAGQGGMNGILSGGNPLFNMGAGILANNSGHYGALGPALGGGLQQGLQQTQLARQQATQNQMYQLQQKKLQKELDDADKKQKALEGFDEQFPQYKGLAQIDPKSALKIAYPQLAANSADPYYQFLPTAAGYASGNARTGEVKLVTGPDGRPYIKSSDSPEVQGAVAGAKAQAGADWKLNTDIPGQVSTDAQVAAQARGGSPAAFSQPQIPPQALPQAQPQGMPTNNFSTPYPVTYGAPGIGGAPGTTATDVAEGTTTDNLGVGNPAKPAFTMNGKPTGIRIPTKAEQAGAAAQATANVDLVMKPKQKAAEVAAESSAKRGATMLGLGNIISEARKVLSGPVKPTSSKFGTATDAVGALVGYSPDGAAEADQLKAIGGALVAKMPRMEGPQSNFDVQNYEKMAGDVGNPNLPIERRLAALDVVEKLWKQYDKTAASASSTPTATYNELPKKAPKGQIIRNPETGQRKRFDGMSWRDI